LPKNLYKVLSENFKLGFKDIIKQLGYKLPCDDDKASKSPELKKSRIGIIDSIGYKIPG